MEEDGKLKISALAFIRGRSLSNVMFIVDEAQNLTPHEIKSILVTTSDVITDQYGKEFELLQLIFLDIMRILLTFFIFFNVQ